MADSRATSSQEESGRLQLIREARLDGFSEFTKHVDTIVAKYKAELAQQKSSSDAVILATKCQRDQLLAEVAEKGRRLHDMQIVADETAAKLAKAISDARQSLTAKLANEILQKKVAGLEKHLSILNKTCEQDCRNRLSLHARIRQLEAELEVLRGEKDDVVAAAGKLETELIFAKQQLVEQHKERGQEMREQDEDVIPRKKAREDVVDAPATTPGKAEQMEKTIKHEIPDVVDLEFSPGKFDLPLAEKCPSVTEDVKCTEASTSLETPQKEETPRKRVGRPPKKKRTFFNFNLRKKSPDDQNCPADC